MSLSTVLVPLDGSAFAEAALPWACRVATSGSAGIHLVTVHEPLPAYAYDDWDVSARAWCSRYLDEVDRRLGEGCESVGKVVEEGRIVPRLEAVAEDLDADLVVMATHGRGALTRAWLGSVADHFVRHSRRPVLLVRPEAEAQPDLGARPAISRILLPLDGSAFSEEALSLASEVTRLLGASLLLAEVVAYPTEIASPYLPHTVEVNQKLIDDAAASARSHLDRIAGRLREEGIETETRVLVDTQAAAGILRIAEEHDADMIVMATHARRGVGRAFLGSTADKVVRGAGRPVLLVRPPHS